MSLLLGAVAGGTAAAFLYACWLIGRFVYLERKRRAVETTEQAIARLERELGINQLDPASVAELEEAERANDPRLRKDKAGRYLVEPTWTVRPAVTRAVSAHVAQVRAWRAAGSGKIPGAAGVVAGGRAVATEWLVAAGPERCKCGHDHYGRTPSDQANVAPQWNYCEDERCRCRALDPVKIGWLP